MVVVLMVFTRANAATGAGAAKFKENERALNMRTIVVDGGLWLADTMDLIDVLY